MPAPNGMPRRQRGKPVPSTPKSDLICVTSFPPAWSELAAITTASHKAYCDARGYDYDAECADLRDRRVKPTFDGYGDYISIRGFHKFNRILHFLPMYKWVVWLDADLVVTNTNLMLHIILPMLDRWETDLIVGHDWNGWNTTVIAVRSTPKMQGLFWAANNTGRDLFLYHPWHEMSALRFFTERPPYNQRYASVSNKAMAAILPECYEPAGVPRPIMEPYAWEPGDFAVHLSALPLERRIELARQFYPEVTYVRPQ